MRKKILVLNKRLLDTMQKTKIEDYGPSKDKIMGGGIKKKKKINNQIILLYYKPSN